LHRYFVGVLDKDSGQMEVYNAEIFNMQPLLSGRKILCLTPAPEFSTLSVPWRFMRQCIISVYLGSIFISISDLITVPVTSCPLADQYLAYDAKCIQQCVLICFCLTQMDLCIEAFGTSKQKRALNSRRMNAVGNDIVNTAVTKAAANIIDAKGVTALIQDVAQDDIQNISIFLPPCNEDADKPENVYKFEDILSPAEYEALQVPAAVFVNITPEEVTKKMEDKSHCSFVLEELKFLPADEKSRDHKARCLWFLDTLIKFSYLKVIKKKRKRIFSSSTFKLPAETCRKLMKNFTSLTYNNGSVQNLISASMKAKITAYVIALALHINNFQTDLTILQNDMKLQESRMMDIAKAMRLKISKAKGLPGLENDQNHKLGTLSVPLPLQKASENQRKRKKMN
ncbi:DNA-directed RNA polymerase I subunit RPA49, partial [Gavia stellata]